MKQPIGKAVKQPSIVEPPGFSIEDSMGVIGSSIGKSANQPQRRRNAAASNNGSKRGANAVNLKGPPPP
jgi:hypothetical protein